MASSPNDLNCWRDVKLEHTQQIRVSLSSSDISVHFVMSCMYTGAHLVVLTKRTVKKKKRYFFFYFYCYLGHKPFSNCVNLSGTTLSLEVQILL